MKQTKLIEQFETSYRNDVAILRLKLNLFERLLALTDLSKLKGDFKAKTN